MDAANRARLQAFDRELEDTLSDLSAALDLRVDWTHDDEGYVLLDEDGERVWSAEAGVDFIAGLRCAYAVLHLGMDR